MRTPRKVYRSVNSAKQVRYYRMLRGGFLGGPISAENARAGINFQGDRVVDVVLHYVDGRGRPHYRVAVGNDPA